METVSDRYSYEQIEKIIRSIETAKTRMIVGTVSVGHLLGIIIYLILFYFIAVKVFEKHELEF